MSEICGCIEIEDGKEIICKLRDGHGGMHHFEDRYPGEKSERREAVDHPRHYGGDTVYEAIKVIEAWDLGFHLGNALKYICRAHAHGTLLEDLKKARWYLDRYIQKLEKGEGRG